MLKLLLIAIIYNLLLIQAAVAQTRQPETLVATEYKTLFNGQLEQPYTRKYLTAPYYREAKYVEGELVTPEGLFYKDVLMRLDLLKHRLIVLSSVSEQQVIVPWQKVEEVRLHGQTFCFHQKSQLPGDPYTGYLREVYRSEHFHLVEAFTFEEKKIESDRMIRLQLEQKGRFYLIRSDRWIILKSLSDLQRQLPYDTKKQIKQYTKEKGLELKTDPDSYWKAVLQYCETL